MREKEKFNIETSNKNDNEINYQSDNLKEVLLRQLPSELQPRWLEASVDDIQNVINERKDLGFETIIGYHCSNEDLSAGDFILPGGDNAVHYATDIKKLYGKKGTLWEGERGLLSGVYGQKNKCQNFGRFIEGW